MEASLERSRLAREAACQYRKTLLRNRGIGPPELGIDPLKTNLGMPPILPFPTICDAAILRICLHNHLIIFCLSLIDWCTSCRRYQSSIGGKSSRIGYFSLEFLSIVRMNSFKVNILRQAYSSMAKLNT